MNTDKRLQNTRDFLNFNIKFGVYEPELFDGMTDEELITFVEHEQTRADLAIDAYKETPFYETYEKGGE